MKERVQKIKDGADGEDIALAGSLIVQNDLGGNIIGSASQSMWLVTLVQL